jgi:asparagine synthase (glutamine-hydrolysing)
MWALAIRDNRSGDLFLARDRFGIKPFVYCQSKAGFAFASEVRALLALPSVPRELDVETATRLLFDPFSVEAGERTLVRSVRRLPAGHCAMLRNGDIRVKRWWYTADHLPAVAEDTATQIARFRELFFDAVRIRLRSDVPLGTCLSGGFDSSAITCAIAEISRGRERVGRETEDWRHAFIAAFPGQPNDETEAALEVAAYADVRPHVTELTDADALSHIKQVLEDLDDVYISLPTAPWQIYRQLRAAKIPVSLDGHGADELMGGYRQGGESFSFILRNCVASAAHRSSRVMAVFEAGKAVFLSMKGLNFLRHHRWSAPRAAGTPFDHDALPAHWGPLNHRLYRMFHATVLPTILRNFDRMSMAHGVEVRMPFMDWRLVTFVMALPDSAKSSGEQSKLVARKAMAGSMPEGIRINTRKVGFNSPMPGWMNGPLKPWLDQLLRADTPAFSEIVDVSALRRRVDALTSARAWDWEAVGRLWPYMHLKWYIDDVINAPSKVSRLAD